MLLLLPCLPAQAGEEADEVGGIAPSKATMVVDSQNGTCPARKQYVVLNSGRLTLCLRRERCPATSDSGTRIQPLHSPGQGSLPLLLADSCNLVVAAGMEEEKVGTAGLRV